MNKYFYKKVVVVTGSSSGIGYALTELLLKKGSYVIGCSRTLSYSNNLKKKYVNSFFPLKCDVTDSDHIRNLNNFVVGKFNKIDILINNAGIGLPKLFKDTDALDIKKLFETNFFSMVNIIKSFLPLFLKQKSGYIVNIASIAGKTVSTHNSIYGASKYATIGFSDHLRRELEGSGIKVLVVNPTFVDTPFFKKNPTYLEKFGHHTKLVGFVPANKMAAKIADAVEKNKDELTYPFLANLYSKIHALSPRFAKIFA